MLTSLDDPKVEESLRSQLALVVRETVKVFGSECTIILAGGFGRGEGSIRFGNGHIPVPLHDFDLYVVTDRKVDSRTHALMEESILTELSRLTGSDLTLENFVLGVEVVPSKGLSRLPPDLSTYEMKAASTVLHGPDVRSKIPVRDRDIALGSGAITLFHRATALLKNVEPEYLSYQAYPLDRALEAVYECCKVYTEICTAFSLLGGFYEPSYRRRAELFKENFRLFPSIRRQLPDLAETISFHTQMKLLSDFSPIIHKPAETWVEARHALDVCLRAFLSRFLRIESVQPWSELCRETHRGMKRFFFQDYLSFYLKRLGIRGSPGVYAANVLFQAYDFQSFKRKARRLGRQPASQAFSLTSPIIDIYVSSSLVLFSLLDDGNIDRNLLGLGRSYIGRELSLHSMGQADHESWKTARDACVEGQHLYFGVKQQKIVL